MSGCSALVSIYSLYQVPRRLLLWGEMKYEADQLSTADLLQRHIHSKLCIKFNWGFGGAWMMYSLPWASSKLA